MQAGLVAAGIALAASPARGQLLDRFFPEGVIGYGAATGVTVLSRDRLAYEPLGVRTGGVVVRPTLSTAFGYTSNAAGRANGRGSAFAQTSGSLLAGTQWGRHALGGFLSFDDQRYASASAQSATGWTASLGGSLDLGRDRLTLAAAHIDTFQTARSLDGLAIDRPGRIAINNLRAGYTVDLGRIVLLPGLAVTYTRHDDVFVGGQRLVQRYRDRIAYDGNVTARWELAPQRALVVDLRATAFDHATREPGRPSRDATTVAALAGIDYAANAVWRVRALAGVQHRRFADPTLGAVTGPIAEVAVIWTPSGLTTVGLSLARRLEDAAELAAVSYTFSQARVSLDHELRRHILLRATLDVQQAEYQQRSGLDRSVNLGVSATWLVNRSLRVSAGWDYGTRQPATGGAVNESVTLLRLRLAL